MTAVASTTTTAETVRSPRSRFGEVWRITRLHFVNPSIFIGVPWIILGGALVVTILLALIIRGAGGPIDDVREGFRYSWAVLSPQWYLVVVGVQAVGLTFSFALGFGATRRDFWLGTSLAFVLVSTEMAIAIATLVQIEQATNGWFVGAGMFDALWYGQHGWLFDFYSSFALEMLVLFIGSSLTTVYMRWRIKGMMTLTGGSRSCSSSGAIATATFTGSWPSVFAWLAGIGLTGVFTLLLGLAVVFAIFGYFVIRRATPR